MKDRHPYTTLRNKLRKMSLSEFLAKLFEFDDLKETVDTDALLDRSYSRIMRHSEIFFAHLSTLVTLEDE